MRNEEETRCDGDSTLSATILDSEVDFNSLRACVVLVLADLFDRNPALREHFLNSLQLARNKAENEKSDAKVLILDVASSFIQKIPPLRDPSNVQTQTNAAKWN
jgi:hypothetical protein